jgi:hypothetical protein
MTPTDFYILFSLEVVTVALLVGEFVVKSVRWQDEFDKETEAFEKRLAARQTAGANVSAKSGNDTTKRVS